MLEKIPGNDMKNSVECLRRFRGMFKKIPGNVPEDWGIFGKIPRNAQADSGKCSKRFR